MKRFLIVWLFWGLLGLFVLWGCGNRNSLIEKEAMQALEEFAALWEDRQDAELDEVFVDVNAAEEDSDDFVTDEGNVFSEGVDTDYETDLVARISRVFDEIVIESMMDFDVMIPVTFNRYVQTNDGFETLSVDGYGITAVDVPVANDYAMESFFQDNGREMDLNNMADGTSESMVGYVKDEIGCVIYWYYYFDEEMKNGGTTFDVEVKCGSIAVW